MDAHLKFLFDLHGVILIPGVLTGAEVTELVEHAEAVRADSHGLPEERRHVLAGPGARLIDHPVVMDVVHEVIGKTEKVRLENAFYNHRRPGSQRWAPHAGGRTRNPVYRYGFHDGQPYSAMLRVVWELAEVREGQGGTCFIRGSHKANLPFPEEVDAPDSGAWWTYSCPPGSVLFFSEAVRHSAAPWTADHPRQAIFACYNHICVRHHRPTVPREVIASLTPERQRFFAEPYHPQFDREAFESFHNLEPLGWRTVGPQRF